VSRIIEISKLNRFTDFSTIDDKEGKMAIKRSDLIELTAEDVQIVDEFEGVVDDALRLRYDEGQELAILISDDNLHPRVKRELIKRYEALDWKGIEIKDAKDEYAEQDGMCIVFPG